MVLPQHTAVIVGAGFGGMGAAIQLDRLGIEDFVILERESDLGGTWHVNTYPGLAVDIPSVTYSYSFEPNPFWSRMFAPGTELKRYATHVADRYDLKRRMRFDAVVDGAQWDETNQFWSVSLRDGSTLTARYLLTATGFLSQPRMPDIEGIDSFAGKVIHTARWDHDYDLTGRRAALIGTGATAVQLIPKVAQEVADLTVYQRTPIWVAPKIDGDIPRAVQMLFARLPLAQKATRLTASSVVEALLLGGVLHYRQLSAFNRLAEQLSKAHIRRQVHSPELRRKLTPQYSFGCKRPTFSNDYYPTFNRRHVHLETTAIAHIEPDGIVTADGRKTEIDTLICATGYNIWDTNFPAIRIIGRDGADLGKWWRETRFQSYEGIAIPGFPNLLSLVSPFSYNGLSYFWTIEAQMKHMKRLFGAMNKKGMSTFEVTREANDRFVERMQRELDDSVFVLGNCASANSYYFDTHGEPSLLRPTSSVNGLREASRFPINDYRFSS